MNKYRLVFEKTGRAKYISHLDLMRTFQRVFMRAGVPIKHTEGFNPHPYISIVLPLSLGCESHCELLDFEPGAPYPMDMLPERLNAVMPEGIRCLSVAERVKKPGALKYVRCMLTLEYDGGAPDVERLRAFWAQERIEISKKTKRGTGTLDIRPHIRALDLQPVREKAVHLLATISAQEPTINPMHLADALNQLAPELAPDFARPCRLEVFDENMEVFR